MIYNPFVPTDKVKAVAINSDYIHLLKSMNIAIIPINGDKNIPEYIRNHTDLNFFNTTNKLFLSEITLTDENNTLFNNKPIKKVKLGKTYNEYNKLNAFVLSETIFGNLKILDKDLIDSYKCSVNIKQSYAKCSTAIVSDKAAITDDISVYKAIINSGFDALLISKGDIKLNSKDYGFIGGASGLIDKNLLAFTGDIKTHSDYIAIKEFTRNHSCYIESLCKGSLLDIGGILPIM